METKYYKIVSNLDKSNEHYLEIRGRNPEILKELVDSKESEYFEIKDLYTLTEITEQEFIKKSLDMIAKRIPTPSSGLGL